MKCSMKMTRVFGTGVIVLAALWAVPAAAQGANAASSPSGPVVNSWYLGANTGTAVVENFGSVAGAEGGLRVKKNLYAVGEISWMQDVVARRQVDKIATLAASLAATQGAAASGDITVPALYGGLGLRWVFENSSRIRPYAQVTFGGVRTELKPSLVLGGANITSAASQYGVTLGQDVIGKYRNMGTEAGIGAMMGIRTFYLDLGVRLLSINSTGQRTNVSRLVIGGGFRY